MAEWQIGIVRALGGETALDLFMQSTWGWPAMESLHFIGLCLLVGTVGVFDLRLLGVGRRIPIAAVHRLIPLGLAGFALNAVTGFLFVNNQPDQYIYNPSFHLKVLFMLVAGVNAGLFYLTSYREVSAPDAGLDAPARAKLIAAVSLAMWVGIIICGRMITFFRPGECFTDPGVILTCVPR